jgi:hypothetical protein
MDSATKARKARQAYKEANRRLYVDEDNLYSMRMRVEQQLLSAKLGKVYPGSDLVRQIVERVLDESLSQDSPVMAFESTGETLLKLALTGVPADVLLLLYPEMIDKIDELRAGQRSSWITADDFHLLA